MVGVTGLVSRGRMRAGDGSKRGQSVIRRDQQQGKGRMGTQKSSGFATF